MDNYHIDECLKIILSCAKLASSKVMAVYKKTSTIFQTKEDKSLITKADIIANNFIIKYLKKYFPCPILTEENNTLDIYDRSDYIFMVDPLDGTREFIARNGEFSINIALVKNGRPAIGVIAIPLYKIIYYGISGKGSYILVDNKKIRLRCSSVNKLDVAKFVISRSHQDLYTKVLQKYVKQVMPCGSAFKYCLIAQGKIDGLLRKTPLMEWDICAADCILREAGGVLTDFDGCELTYGKKRAIFENGIVASNVFMHEILLDFVRQFRENDE